MLDWLLPFDENLVDDEEQRVDRVEVYGDIQDDDQERERELLHKEKEVDRYFNPGSLSAGGSGTRTDARPLP